ncbi:MAG: hypothetical protein ABGF52_05730 [Candidatus Asgardarchaeum sp.]
MGNGDNGTLIEKEEFKIIESLVTPVPPREITRQLWGIAKKYETAIKENLIISIEEAEQDRNIVNMLFRKYTDLKTRILDARILQNFVSMQRLRDVHVIMKYLDKSEIIKYIAYQVKRRGTPIVTFTGYSLRSTPRLERKLTSSKVEPKYDQNISIFKEEAERTLLMFNEEIDMSSVDKLDIDSLKKETLMKLKPYFDKPIKIKTLSRLLSHIQLNILSQMIRDNELFAYKRGKDSIIISKTPKYLSEDNKYETIVIEGAEK